MEFFKRWYDTDTVVSRVIYMFEHAPEEKQLLCADYIIDIFKDGDLKGLSLEEQYNYIMRRWYDKNIKISHAIEYLRLSPVDLRREVALKVEKYLKELLG